MRLLVLGFGHVGRSLLQILPDRLEAAVVSSQGGLNTARKDSLRQAASEQTPLNQLDGFVPLKPMEAVQDWDYDVLVDLTPTVLPAAEPSSTYWKTALQRGKSVVSANKGPLAVDFQRFAALAEENGARLLFEAAVAGGTPVFNLARHCLAGPGLERVEGIVNGTTNYILTQMESGKTYAEALREAQEKGYAERDPKNDVEGGDALAKAVILANGLFGQNTRYQDHAAQGITGITPEDIRQAGQSGECFKLIANVDKTNLSVMPQKIRKTHPLAHIGDAWNALTFYTKNADAITVKGRGAGGLPTASAVLNDVLELEGAQAKSRRQ